MEKQNISVIIPCLNEEKYIEKCIQSVLEQDYPKEHIEILFVDGMSVDKTREIIQKYSEKYSFIKLLDNPQKTVPYALKRGIEDSTGEIIIRLDAHAIFPKDYFSTLVKHVIDLKADNVGGIVRTLPMNDKVVARAIATALSSKFGMGDSHFRVGTNEIKKVDTVPFGCFRRSIFDKIGLFDVELTRNQDDEFNARIIKNGGEIFLIPSVIIDYYARDEVAKVRKMFYQYGMFKPLVNKKIGSPTTLRQFFPLLFVIGLFVGAILSFFHSIFLGIYISVILFYFALSLIFAIKDCKGDFAQVLYLPIIFFLIHFNYGWGYLLGIFKILLNKPFSVKINR